MHNVHACLIISSLQLLLREAVELEHEADGQGDASHPPFPVSLTDMLLASGHEPWVADVLPVCPGHAAAPYQHASAVRVSVRHITACTACVVLQRIRDPHGLNWRGLPL